MDPMEYSSSLFRLFQSWFSSNCWIIYDSKGLERNQKILEWFPPTLQMNNEKNLRFKVFGALYYPVMLELQMK